MTVGMIGFFNDVGWRAMGLDPGWGMLLTAWMNIWIMSSLGWTDDIKGVSGCSVFLRY